MAAKKEKPVEAQFHLVGDKVLWKGILVTVHKINEDGSIYCMSPTLQLLVQDPSQLEKYRG